MIDPDGNKAATMTISEMINDDGWLIINDVNIQGTPETVW